MKHFIRSNKQNYKSIEDAIYDYFNVSDNYFKPPYKRKYQQADFAIEEIDILLKNQ
jgi:hypothetical protein